MTIRYATATAGLALALIALWVGSGRDAAARQDVDAAARERMARERVSRMVAQREAAAAEARAEGRPAEAVAEAEGETRGE